jgi:Ca2+-binding RTX toxin-like protein
MTMKAARRVTPVLVTAILIGATLLIGASSAPAGQRCTLKGTSADDPMVDTGGANVICARGGNDLVEAGVQGDRVRGGRGADRLEGNDGSDVVMGGAGTDTVVTTDGVSGNDRAVGGRGQDTCVIDQGDKVRGCETKQVVA